MSRCTTTVAIDNNYILKLFNLNDKQIESIHVYHDNLCIVIDVILFRESFACPICETTTSKINDYSKKTIKHSIKNNTPLIINYRARRYICLCCNKTFYEPNPFVIKNMKISSMTVYNVLRDLKSSTETLTSVANRYFISTTSVANIFDKHIEISRCSLPEYICIDKFHVIQELKK